MANLEAHRAPQLLDLTLPSPEENLALDEALLVELEAALAAGGDGVEVLRFWESRTPFVTLGVGGRLEAEADAGACARDGVPILRRASGGGTVLQGPGCLNFVLVLALDARPELRDLTRSYAVILSRTAAALGVEGLEHRGISDLALGGRKVSGNAQKRSRRALLHHGTILHAFDLGSIACALREPPKQPAYREGRPHGDFVANLPLAAGEIRERIARAWSAVETRASRPLPDVSTLIREKYSNRAWTERF